MSLTLNSLRTKLIRDPRFNPFNDKYDASIVQQVCDENINATDVESKKLLQTYQCTFILNDIFKQTFNSLKNLCQASGLSNDQIIRYSLAAANRHFIMVQQMNLKEIAEADSFSFEEFNAKKIKSVDASIGDINRESALEGTIDALHVVANYVKFLSYERVSLPELDSINAIIHTSFVSTFFHVIKSSSDDCIWNRGNITLKGDDNKVLLEYLDEMELMLFHAGFLRLSKNSSAFSMVGYEILESEIGISEKIKKVYRAKHRFKRIKEVSTSDGFINYRLADGDAKGEIEWEINNSGSLIAFHSYLFDTVLPDLPGLSLQDVISLWSLIQHLIRPACLQFPTNDEIMKLAHFGKFPYRVKRKELEDYLLRRSFYSKPQVKAFLDILVNKPEDRINFWDYPFLQVNDDLLFSLLAIESPLLLHLTDLWLEKGGFSLDQRGIFFENHIRKTLRKVLTAKGYEVQIPDKSNFTSPDRTSEEIDLIVNLKSVLLICEVKCVKYPMEARDRHNAYMRLVQGCLQAKRKMVFLLENIAHLQSEIGEYAGKEVIPLVITNFPLYSGNAVEEVSIVDFFLLEAYIESGSLTDYVASKSSGKQTFRAISEEKSLYADENEFCANLRANMKNPPVIQQYLKRLHIEEKKISPDGTTYDIFAISSEINKA